jgi:AraC-like DNA-binding protein
MQELDDSRLDVLRRKRMIDPNYLDDSGVFVETLEIAMVVKRTEPAILQDIETLQRLGRAREFIDHCYDHPLSLDQISEQACFSRYHFIRLFRQAFNTTPHQYLIERRIEKAKELLKGDELRVTDVCFEVGFQSLGSFSTLFQKRVGHPPVTYREKAKATQLAKRKVPGCFLVMYNLESA